MAAEFGLVICVVSKEAVLETALSSAVEISANAPLSIRASKRLVRAAAGAGSEWDRAVYAMQAEKWAARLQQLRHA